jgi:hypothetical protein
VFTGTNPLYSTNTVTLGNPSFTVSWIANVTGNYGTDQTLGGFNDNAVNDVEIFYRSAGPDWAIFAGATAHTGSGTMNNATFHAAQALFNTTSSRINVDAATSGSITAGALGVVGTKIVIGDVLQSPSGSGLLSGTICEWIVWSGDKSASFSTLNTNQHTTWGF